MKNLAKTGFYASAGILLTAVHTANAAIDFWESKVQEGLKGSGESADNAIQTIIWNVMGFLWILALWYLLWWGFNILTAWGDEEKVKKGKTVIIKAILWIIVIFLANSLLQWLLGLILV